MFDNLISTMYMTCLTAVKHIVVSLHGFETTVFTREHNRRLVKQERGEDTQTPSLEEKVWISGKHPSQVRSSVSLDDTKSHMESFFRDRQK